MTHIVELKQDKRLTKGERHIIVDGTIWGQTVITYHGVHGTKYRFRQANGDILTEIAPSYGGRLREDEIAVWSDARLRRQGRAWQPTDEKVLNKARELVTTGKLRHPNIVKEENRQYSLRLKAVAEKVDAALARAFRKRAMAALNTNDPDSEIVSRVVEAMKWAQSQ